VAAGVVAAAVDSVRPKVRLKELKLRRHSL
jgi:hypothetical protein